MKITKRQLRRIIKEERTRLREAGSSYPEHMFPDRVPQSKSDPAWLCKMSGEELNNILKDWNNSPHLDPDAMRALPKHVRATLDDLFIRIEDVMLSLKETGVK